VEFKDVFENYSKCSFCGKMLGEQVFRPDTHQRDAEQYHSEECYRFSLQYPELKRQAEDARR